MRLQWLLVLISSSLGYCRERSETRTFFKDYHHRIPPMRTEPGPEKNYTGFRVQDNSILIIYYHDQTIAIVEVALNQQLLNCELLEVKTPSDRKAALQSLQHISRKVGISFPDMRNLMQLCAKLETPKNLPDKFLSKGPHHHSATIFSLIFPGTKWCGRGDIAQSYFDLGDNKQIDKCCRAHDLCPVKVDGLKSKYNITNTSMYTRSHCACDQDFQKCLKEAGSSTANLIETVYFGYTDVVCIDNDHKNMRKVFRVVKLRQ